MSDRIKKIMGIWEVVKEQGLEDDEAFESLSTFTTEREKSFNALQIAFSEYKDLVASKSNSTIVFVVNGQTFIGQKGKLTNRLLDIAIKVKRERWEKLSEDFKRFQ